MLLQVYPKSHPWYKSVFFDTEEKQYYNARTDIYMDDEDILYNNLRPVELVIIPIPEIEDYFLTWHRGESIKMKVLDAIDTVNRSIRPSSALTGVDYEMAKHKLAEEVVLICKSLCPTRTWSSQSDASTQTD